METFFCKRVLDLMERTHSSRTWMLPDWKKTCAEPVPDGMGRDAWTLVRFLQRNAACDDPEATRRRVKAFLDLFPVYGTVRFELDRVVSEIAGVRSIGALIRGLPGRRGTAWLAKGLEDSVEQALRLLEGKDSVVSVFSGLGEEISTMLLRRGKPVIPDWLYTFVLARSDFYLTAALHAAAERYSPVLEKTYKEQTRSIIRAEDWEVVSEDERSVLLCHPLIPHPSHFRLVVRENTYAGAVRTPLSLMNLLDREWCRDAGLPKPVERPSIKTVVAAPAETPSSRWNVLAVEEPRLRKKKRGRQPEKTDARLKKERRKAVKIPHRHGRYYTSECLASQDQEIREHEEFMTYQSFWDDDDDDDDYDW